MYNVRQTLFKKLVFSPPQVNKSFCIKSPFKIQNKISNTLLVFKLRHEIDIILTRVYKLNQLNVYFILSFSYLLCSCYIIFFVSAKAQHDCRL